VLHWRALTPQPMNMVYRLVHVVALSTKIRAAGMFFLEKLCSSVILASNLSIALVAAFFFDFWTRQHEWILDAVFGGTRSCCRGCISQPLSSFYLYTTNLTSVSLKNTRTYISQGRRISFAHKHFLGTTVATSFLFLMYQTIWFTMT
jgi:hypothetical protein